MKYFGVILERKVLYIHIYGPFYLVLLYTYLPYVSYTCVLATSKNRSMGSCVVWDGDIHFLLFYFILISTLENIRYLMTYIPDISNMSTVISSFGDILEKYCI